VFAASDGTRRPTHDKTEDEDEDEAPVLYEARAVASKNIRP
jgi:hypothetical protein